MTPARLRLFATAALVIAGGLAGAAAAEEAVEASGTLVDGVVVQGGAARTVAATGLELSLRETPQSVSVVSHQQIEDFGLTNVNDLLSQVVGINVERVETDRTYYNARGFDITNFQVDGVGLPLIWGIQYGDLDTAVFDRVEAVRGANALMTGTGNPSATINYVRKRPTDAFRAEGSIQYGTWDAWRLEADVSGPLNAAGTVRGRLVYANEDRGSHLDYYGVNRNVYYGVVDWDVTPDLTLTAGYSRQDNRAKGVLWGALPLTYSDGTPIDLPSSATTSANWTYWNTHDDQLFGEAAYSFDNGWRLKSVLTHKRFREEAKLLYAFGNPDPATGLGVGGMVGIYPSVYRQTMVDVTASGPFSLFGREHELVVGGHASRSHGLERENFAETYPDFPAVALWGSVQVAEPAYPGEYLAADQTDKMLRAYAAAHLNLADPLKAVVGVNAVKLTSRGFSYGVETPRDETAVSPYLGLIYDLTPHISLYASYTDIFNPQSEVDLDRRRLSPAHGQSYEAGVKSEWLDKRLYVTAAVFRAKQGGLAEYAGVFPDGKSFYTGVDTTVTGYEVEATGAVSDRWTVAGGFTDLKIEDDAGARARTYVPRRTFKASATYSAPELRNLKLGAALRWQDDVSVQDLVLIRQKAYAEVDLMAGIDLTEQVRATVNVRNATDKKHLTSLMWNQSYYAAPRSVSVRLVYAF